MVGKHGWLAMVAGLAIGVSVGLVNVPKALAQATVPVRTAVLTSSDQATVTATPVHWGGGFYGGRGYYGARGFYGGYRPYFYGAYYRPFYRPYAYYRPYFYRPYYAPYYVSPPYVAAYPSVYPYAYPTFAPSAYYGVVPYGGSYYW